MRTSLDLQSKRRKLIDSTLIDEFMRKRDKLINPWIQPGYVFTCKAKVQAKLRVFDWTIQKNSQDPLQSSPIKPLANHSVLVGK